MTTQDAMRYADLTDEALEQVVRASGWTPVVYDSPDHIRRVALQVLAKAAHDYPKRIVCTAPVCPWCDDDLTDSPEELDPWVVSTVDCAECGGTCIVTPRLRVKFTAERDEREDDDDVRGG